MAARFFAPDAGDVGQVVGLPAFEAEHLTRVLRLGPGAVVHVFDGRGRAFEAVVERTGRTSAEVRLSALRAPAPERRVRITVAPSLLKGDKFDEVVRDATMMGAAAIQPVVADRSEVPRAALARSPRQERWHRIAVSSAKQCGRAVVPDVLVPATVAEVIGVFAGSGATEALMFVEPAAATTGDTIFGLPVPPSEALVLIGPEGGWSEAELAAAHPAVRRITLRGPTMRADAMPLVGLTALLTAWGEM